MALFERLVNVEEPNLPVHPFLFALEEHHFGHITEAEFKADFGLSDAEYADSQQLKALIINTPDYKEAFRFVWRWFLYASDQGRTYYRTQANLVSRLQAM